MPDVEWLDLGETGYDDALVTQRGLHEECWRGVRPDVLLFQSNEPVITCGVDSEAEHILWDNERLRRAGIKMRSVPRGGGVSYHGPGQIVVSTILHFLRYRRTAHLFLRAIEEVVIRLLGRCGVDGSRIDGKSGVFVGNDKIAAVGLALSHSVMTHGVSLNICPDMRHYGAIVACGLADSGVTSLETLGRAASYDGVRDGFIAEFADVFGATLRPMKNFPPN
ncbi:MAG: lipoyl(octanoyl) transferase LipB [Synergistaceae bacterium]|jgi:lipoate-protein ligase B|nr:lipoyl(octanoyl) transferase LipB [Synergistaceae bacterium]